MAGDSSPSTLAFPREGGGGGEITNEEHFFVFAVRTNASTSNDRALGD